MTSSLRESVAYIIFGGVLALLGRCVVLGLYHWGETQLSGVVASAGGGIGGILIVVAFLKFLDEA